MQHLLNQLARLNDQKIGDNKIYSFLPYRKGAKEFDYDVVGCNVLSTLMGKHVKKNFSFEKYKTQCLDHLKDKLSDPDVLVDLEEMYFSDATIAKTAPEFLLLRSQEKCNTSTKYLIDLFRGFVSQGASQLDFDSGMNFIERIFLDILSQNLQEPRVQPTEACYLPFVAENFRRDVLFLSKHPDYFLDQLTSCIELYTFIYCSQLGLNIKNWTNGEVPSSKPLYFILDTEKASSERTLVMKGGYRSVAPRMADVFPILSMLEYLNNDSTVPKEPLWAFANAVRSTSAEQHDVVFAEVSKFAEEFRKKRKLHPTNRKPSNAIECMQQLTTYGIKQFDKSAKGDRHSVNATYIKFFETGVANNFIQARGRSSKVLVVNQDFLLLLTNLAIANRSPLRFQTLLAEFQSRGFYFDKSSQQALINFYERVGNVDRMSDSGDAVYVRNTI
ncbi:DNA phosphorothioation-dependent restriction protein DptG [Novipirellula caenicola]|uniref:DNA phosphorothioation-dependent restriction protein DptG n=1 Tax=Novipirellula caenicola TaxID=1536901 RepID=A0ABP9VVF7_9BACT